MIEPSYAKWLLDPNGSSDVLVEGYLKSLNVNYPSFSTTFKNVVVSFPTPPDAEIKIACTDVNQVLMNKMKNGTLSGTYKKVLMIVMDE
jgi:hypothetical protein